MNAVVFLRNDIRLLWRHGFSLAYLVTAVLYAAVLSALPRPWADAVLPVLAWSDAAFFSFFFAGASVCLDLAQGTFRALFVSPLRPWVYFLGKAANLAVLSFAMAVAVSVACRGADFRPLPLAAAVLLGAAPSAFIGAALALRLRTVNRFMIGSIPVFLALALPAVRYAAGGLVSARLSTVVRFLPAEGSLVWSRAAYAPVPGKDLVLGAAAAIAWAAAAAFLFLGPAASRGREA